MPASSALRSGVIPVSECASRNTRPNMPDCPPEHRVRSGMQDFTTRPEIRGTFGAGAPTPWLAGGVAISTCERGGSAFAGAAGGGFPLRIFEPRLVGPGGEVPII